MRTHSIATNPTPFVLCHRIALFLTAPCRLRRCWLHITNQDGVRDRIEGTPNLNPFLMQFFGIDFVGDHFVDPIQRVYMPVFHQQKVLMPFLITGDEVFRGGRDVTTNAVESALERPRSEEHTSELQSPFLISYA